MSDQLTLEQVATKYGENNGTFGTMEPLASAFEAGAEWQKEQFISDLHRINGLQIWINDRAMKKLFSDFINKYLSGQ